MCRDPGTRVPRGRALYGQQQAKNRDLWGVPTP